MYRFRRLALLVVLMVLAASPVLSGLVRAQDGTPAASPVAGQTLEITGLVDHPLTLTVADLEKLTTQSVDVTFKSGQGDQAHSYTGALLSDVIALASPTYDADVKNQSLHRYLVITANDGYEVVISMGEIDPGFGNQPYLLAWEQDGAALTGTDGPVRLVTPGDIKGGRYVTGVIKIEVRDIDSEPRPGN
jgi:DMSO/TMAO reductase YedYZ molybdopterin-dependent catalytic subunit